MSCKIHAIKILRVLLGTVEVQKVSDFQTLRHMLVGMQHQHMMGASDRSKE